MIPKRNSKRAFTASIMSLILCVTMLLGTTLAWFTDTVSNTGNRIKSGVLNIELLMDKNENGNYEDDGENISNGTGDIFSEATGNGILWEPGKTEIVFLQVKNEGNLAIKYEMLLDVTNVTGDAYKLTDVLDYAIIDGMTSEMYTNLYRNTGNAGWENILKANGVQTGDVKEGEVTAAPNGQLLANSSDYVMLAVHMDENATNEYMNKEVIIDVQIDATQLPSESDSFGNDYDAAASGGVEDDTEEDIPQYIEVDLVKNGDLQKLASDGVPENWTNYGGSAVSFVTDDATGNVYSSHNGSGYFQQQFAISDNTLEYTFSADLNKTSTAGRAYIKLEFYSATAYLGEVGEVLYDGEATDGWEKVEIGPFTIPEGTTRCNLAVRSLDTGAEMSWDNIKVTYKKLISGVVEVDLLKNGDLQKLGDNGVPENWTNYGGSAVSFVTDDATGNVYSKHSGSGYFQQQFAISDTALEYTFSADLNKTSTAGRAYIKLEFYSATAFLGQVEKVFYEGEATDGWVNVEIGPFTIPEGTTRSNLAVRSLDTGVELNWDNMKVTYEKEASSGEAYAIAEEFRAMLAEEEANSMKVTAEVIDSRVELEPLKGQPETIIENGNFEDGLNNWEPFNENAKKYISLAEGEGRDGSDALKFSATAADNPMHPIYEQVVDIVGGSEFQVSYWYKITEGNDNKPCIKLEAWGDIVNEIVTGYDQTDIMPVSYERDGEWHYVVQRFRIPNDAKELHIYGRMYTLSNEDQTAYLDDVTVCMTAAPLIMDLDTDSIFYYDDADTAAFKTIANVEFFPDLANAKSDFQVYDGQTLVWEQKGVTASAGTATVTMSLAGLRKEVPYCVKGTVYNADGTVADVQTQNIYVYSRPEYLTKDGFYIADGEEPFVPVIAYHVEQEHYDEVAAAGINLVQMTIFSSADTAVEWLDTLQEAGLMGFIPLYANMVPAGDEMNIDRTIAILSDERVVNHPALFGYGVMDEVFVNLEDPYEAMENSFRLIRMLDSKHPIMSVEAFNSYYYEVGKMVDILVIDPYYTASTQLVTTATVMAKEAVNYEKPVYTLLEAYRTGAGRFMSAEDARNNNWQALIGGADGIGYYSISDSEKDASGKYTVPIWDAEDDGALWNALSEWGTKERDIAFAHFVLDESPVFNKDIDAEDPYWYYSWVVDDSVYMVVLGMENKQELEVSIPLTSADGSVKIGAYTAEVIAGAEEATSGNGTLNLTVNGVEAILYKITPSTAVDFSSLK